MTLSDRIFNFIGTSVLVMLVLARLLHDSQRSPYWFRLTVEVFAGWMLIATIANISVWLVSLGLLSSDSMPWKNGVIIAAACINAYSVWRYQSWGMLAVFIWTLIGILVE